MTLEHLGRRHGQSSRNRNDRLPKQVRSYAEPSNVEEAHKDNEESASNLDESDFVTVTEDHDLPQSLHQRYIGLIAIAGAVVRLSTFYWRTDIWYTCHRTVSGSGGSILPVGPLGTLLGYATVGLIVCSV